LVIGGVFTVKIVTRKQFIDYITPIANDILTNYNIQPNISIAQASFESNFGQSNLAKTGNNLFGIQATSDWIAAGKPVYTTQKTKNSTSGGFLGLFTKTTTTKISVGFKKYNSWAESFTDWAELIANSGRYEDAYFSAQQGDLQSYAQQVKAAGYDTTDINYASDLVSVDKTIKLIG